jgi:lipid II:glycine glycyltransferase (peptidoglycan interpeptide bridge formation enzyme)
MTYKILTTKNKKEWESILKKTGTSDIYFTPEYAKIYENSYNKLINETFCGESILFFSGNEENFVILSTLKRKINNLDFLKKKKEKIYYDLISPYGYGGPIIKHKTKQKTEVMEKFKKDFANYCQKNNIVTEFIRFNPIIQNHKDFANYIKVDKRNKTVYIDLTKNKEILLKEMNKKTRNLIKKAQKNNIQISLSKKREDMKKFFELYEKTMKKTNASQKYFFPEKFFKNTYNYLGDNISLFTAKYKDKIIATSLFMHKGNSIHYHFSGSDKNYLNLSPNNLLLWYVALWAKKQGYKKFHLGGGLSNNPKDSLFHFKSGFSNTTRRFYTASLIHNNKSYKTLNILKNIFQKEQEKDQIKKDFFPHYRG